MITIGTRGSALALAQARIVASAIGSEAVLRTLSTAGDRSERPIRELGDGVFVTAIEDALRRGEIDVAVHSLKDLPTSDPEGLAIVAIPAREDPRDVVITRDRRGPAGLRPGHRVGTSSPRREAFVTDLAPGVICVEIRGNVDTRLAKVERGEYDAAILAAAGLRRLGIAFGEHEVLPIELCPPAPGQGALAVQMRADDPRRERVRELLDDPETRAAVETERAILRLAGATCLLALGAFARRDADGILVDAAFATASGIRRARAAGSEPAEIARRAADALGVLAHA